MSFPQEKYGFKYLFDVRERSSIADLIKGPRRRCGIYLLIFGNGDFYIGKAYDVTRRFLAHRDKYDDLTEIAFQSVPKYRLDEVEKSLIQQAERDGLRLRNVTHTSTVLRETDFDLLVSREEQATWLETGRRPSAETRSLELDGQRASYHTKFAVLIKHPRYKEVLRLLVQYVHKTIPYPRRTEQTFWSISCLPGGNGRSFRRYSVITLNLMQTFVVAHKKKRQNRFIIHIYAARSVLFPNDRELAFRLKYPFVRIDKLRKLNAAGHDQVNLTVNTLSAAMRLLNDTEVAAACRLLNLNLMRKGVSRYGSSHCANLADQILDDYGSA